LPAGPSVVEQIAPRFGAGKDIGQMRAIVGRERAQDEAGRGQGRLHGDVVMSAQEIVFSLFFFRR